jgi:hypothetical protein
MDTTEIEKTFSTVACPNCGQVGTMQVGTRMVTQPIGSFSLAGQAIKFSAIETPALICSTDGCDFYKVATRATED